MNDKKENQFMLDVVERSKLSADLNIVASELQIEPTEEEEFALKNFTMWTLVTLKIEKDETKKCNISCHHKVHASWNMEDKNSSEYLIRGLLRCLIPQVGIKKIEEILTELRIGAKIDEEDNIN